jgi:TatD DNase family protein
LQYSKKAIEIEEKYSDIVLGATAGLHPNDNIDEIFNKEMYLELARNPKVVAIGECGLDYFRTNDDETKKRQKEVFRMHIDIAKEVGKPLMIHSRPSKGSMDAYNDALEILSEYEGLKGNFHFYVGDLETTKKVLDKGFTLSFDGPITFARDYDEVIRYIPLDKLHAETDAPFAAPVPYRGKTCEPWMVIEVVKKIAEIKGLSIEEAREALIQNAKRDFLI